ncbi:tetratricopeptide repeat protein [Spirochaeta cellobiosiphila]|uniref:tetratricopeptide repeat protein n=1 Tax=Spirochaeta cellobiosiphila TaxID=504483 RepID=UPI000414915F|nr:tetratricopeptide repeat protein [Spirochaeta cellobiosiphila]
MKVEGVLKKAQSLYNKKKYNAVIRLLEKEIFTYRDNMDFYILLGYSCLHLNDFGAAESYLKRAQQLDHENLFPYLGIGYLALRRRNIDKALSLYLNILDDYPNQKMAKRALKLLRDVEDPNLLPDILDKSKKGYYLPNLGSVWDLMRPILSVVIVAIVLISGSVLTYPLIMSHMEEQKRDGVSLDIDVDQYFDMSGEYQTVLTENEIKAGLKRVNRYFQDHKDNLVRKEINYLLMGNVNGLIKDRVSSLLSHLDKPSFATLDTNYPYSEVKENPYLYENTYVIWPGRISNPKIGDKITFDFLIGYTDGKVLEGIVPVEVNFGINLDDDTPIEVLGQIHIREGKVYLEALSIHKLKD